MRIYINRLSYVWCLGLCLALGMEEENVPECWNVLGRVCYGVDVEAASNKEEPDNTGLFECQSVCPLVIYEVTFHTNVFLAGVKRRHIDAHIITWNLGDFAE